MCIEEHTRDVKLHDKRNVGVNLERRGSKMTCRYAPAMASLGYACGNPVWGPRSRASIGQRRARIGLAQCQHRARVGPAQCQSAQGQHTASTVSVGTGTAHGQHSVSRHTASTRPAQCQSAHGQHNVSRHTASTRPAQCRSAQGQHTASTVSVGTGPAHGQHMPWKNPH